MSRTPYRNHVFCCMVDEWQNHCNSSRRPNNNTTQTKTSFTCKLFKGMFPQKIFRAKWIYFVQIQTILPGSVLMISEAKRKPHFARI